MVQDIIDSCSYDLEYLGKSDMTAGDHYIVTLHRGNDSVSFDYHDNAFNDSDLTDYVTALVLDAETYKSQNWAVQDIIDELSPKLSYEQAEKMLADLKDNAEKADKLFTESEQKEISENY